MLLVFIIGRIIGNDPGSLRKQGLGVSPIVQQNQEFSIQNEDFPALPGFKGLMLFSFHRLIFTILMYCGLFFTYPFFTAYHFVMLFVLAQDSYSALF